MNRIPYVGVEEDVSAGKWGIFLGSPNPDDEHYIEMPNKEKAFEVQNKLRAFFKEENWVKEDITNE